MPRRLERCFHKEEHRLTGFRDNQATPNREVAYYRAFTLFVPTKLRAAQQKGKSLALLSVRRDQSEVRLASPLHLAGLFAGRLPPMTRKLFSANPKSIGRFDGPPMSDAVPASLVDGTPGDLKADLIALLGKENVLHRAIDLVRYASDASPYRLVPQVVVLPRTTDDIDKLFRY